ncbi:hypothetical protein EV122DRAFT_284593 [Schizophyllum commune]
MGSMRCVHNTVPIARLPPDVLLEFFDACILHNAVDDHSSYLGAPYIHAAILSVAAVCRDWRNLAIQTPSLWTNIHINFWRGNLSNATTLLRILLSRSAELPLSITMRSSDNISVRQDEAEPLVSALLAHSARWACLDVRVSEGIFRLLAPARGRVPQLRGVRFRFLYNRWPRMDWESVRGLFGDCPALVDVDHRGPELDFPWEQLERLSLSGWPPPAALERTTRARVLCFGEGHVDRPSYGPRSLESISRLERPALRKLAVDLGSHLRYFRAPNLVACHVLQSHDSAGDLRCVTRYVLAESVQLTTLSLALACTLATELGELLSHCRALSRLQLNLIATSSSSVSENTAAFDGVLCLLVVRHDHQVLMPALLHLGLMMNLVLSADAAISLAEIVQSRAAAPTHVAASLQSVALRIRSVDGDIADGISYLAERLKDCQVLGSPTLDIDPDTSRGQGREYRLKRVWREAWTAL